MIYIPNKNNGRLHHPEGIIIHSIGEIIDTETQAYYAPYFLEKTGLSAHYFVTPSGTEIESVSPGLVAHHAKHHNKGTIGIEVMVPGAHTYEKFVEAIKGNWVSEVQYQALLGLINDLVQRFKIKSIDRHSDVDPDRKVDPGEGFPWERLKKEVCL